MTEIHRRGAFYVTSDEPGVYRVWRDGEPRPVCTARGRNAAQSAREECARCADPGGPMDPLPVYILAETPYGFTFIARDRSICEVSFSVGEWDFGVNCFDGATRNEPDHGRSSMSGFKDGDNVIVRGWACRSDLIPQFFAAEKAVVVSPPARSGDAVVQIKDAKFNVHALNLEPCPTSAPASE